MKLVDRKVLWLPGGGSLNAIPDCCPLSRAESARQPHLPTSSAPPPIKGTWVPGARPETWSLIKLLFREPSLCSLIPACCHSFQMGLDAGVLASAPKKAHFGKAMAVVPVVTGSCVLGPTRSGDWVSRILQGSIIISVATVNIFMN